MAITGTRPPSQGIDLPLEPHDHEGPARRVRDLLRLIARSRWSAPALLAILLATAAQAWFEAGSVIATGDNFPVGMLNPDDGLGAGRWLWGPGVTPTGGIDYVPTLYSVPALIGKVLQILGLGAGLRQNVYLTLLFVGMGLSMYLLLRALLPGERDRIAAAVGALFYACNPAMFNAIPNAAILANLVLLPLLPALILRGAASRGWRHPMVLAVASVGLSYAFVNPPMFALVLAASVVAGVVILVRDPRGASRFLLRAGLLAGLLNLWWLVPVGLALLGPAGDRLVPGADSASWAWTHQRSSLWNVVRLVPQWSWPRPEYVPYAGAFEVPPLSIAMALPAAVSLLLPVVTRGARRRAAFVVLGVAAGLAVLAKGLHPPATALNEWLYRGVPGMWLFREPQAKFTFVLAAVLGIGLALLVASPWSRRVRLGMVAMIVAVTAWISHPIWLGSVVPDARPGLPASHVRIPEHWTEAADFLDANPGRVLLLPPNDYYQLPYRWGYYGADQIADELIASPVIRLLDPAGNVYIGPDRGALGVTERLRKHLERGEWSESVRISRLLGIRWLVVRGDVDWRAPGRTLMDPASMAEQLGRVDGLREARSFGPLRMFEVDAAHGRRVWAASGSVESEAGDVALGTSVPIADGAAIVGGSSPSSGSLAAIGRSEWREDSGGLSADLGPAGGTLYARWVEGMPLWVRAESASDGGTTLSLAPDLSFSGASVRNLVDRTTLPVDARPEDILVTLDGRPLPDRLATVAPGDHELVAMVPDASSLEDGSFERGDWGRVGDCLAEDDRTPEEVGLRARRVQDGHDGTWALELAATDHAACVRQVVPDVDTGALYRLRLSSRHLSGAPPRVCVWQEGPDRCAPLPPLAEGEGWRAYDQSFKPEPGTTQLVVHLYADGDPAGTRVRYDGLALDRYREGASTPFQVPAGWAPIGSVRPGATASLLTPGEDPVLPDPSFEEGTWGPVSDCNASDGLDLDGAGLGARRVRGGTDGGYALELSARAHVACVSQDVEGFTPGALHRLTLSHHGIEGAVPRLCVWEMGPDACASIPPLRGGSGWQRSDIVFRASHDAAGLQLFLYADGEPGGTTVRYDDVRLRLTPPRPELAVVDPPPGRAAAELEVTIRNPSDYRVAVSGAKGPFLLVLDETYDRDWHLSGAPGSRHIRVNGYANGWVVDRSGDFDLRIVHVSQAWVGMAWSVSGIALLGLVLAAIIGFLWRATVPADRGGGSRRLRGRPPSPPPA